MNADEHKYKLLKQIQSQYISGFHLPKPASTVTKALPFVAIQVAADLPNSKAKKRNVRVYVSIFQRRDWVNQR